MDNDPFSDFLWLTNAQPVISGGFTAGGAWAIRFPLPDKIKFFAVVKGHCWLDFEDEQERIRVDTGDVLLLSAQRTFVLAGDLPASPILAKTLFSGLVSKTAKLGDGADFTQIGGHVQLDPVSGGLLTNILPPLIHVRSTSPQAPILRWLMDRLLREREECQPGASLSAAHLAQLIFVQILRAHLDTALTLSSGWLRAVGDRRVAPALQLLHADPARNWHLEELARVCAMSRTSFAQHFKAVAGVAPLTYLTNWRMMLAERALRQETTAVSELAQSIGYASDSAFSTAFKRVWGQSPKHYRDAMGSPPN